MQMANTKKDWQTGLSSKHNPGAVCIMASAFQIDIYKFSASGHPALSLKQIWIMDKAFLHLVAF